MITHYVTSAAWTHLIYPTKCDGIVSNWQSPSALAGKVALDEVRQIFTHQIQRQLSVKLSTEGIENFKSLNPQDVYTQTEFNGNYLKSLVLKLAVNVHVLGVIGLASINWGKPRKPFASIYRSRIGFKTFGTRFESIDTRWILCRCNSSVH